MYVAISTKHWSFFIHDHHLYNFSKLPSVTKYNSILNIFLWSFPDGFSYQTTVHQYWPNFKGLGLLVFILTYDFPEYFSAISWFTNIMGKESLGRYYELTGETSGLEMSNRNWTKVSDVVTTVNNFSTLPIRPCSIVKELFQQFYLQITTYNFCYQVYNFNILL